MKAPKISLLINIVLQGELGRLKAFFTFYEIFLPSPYVLNQCVSESLSFYLKSNYTTILVVQGGKHIMGVGADVG